MGNEITHCENCKYFDELGDDESAGQAFGHCRRYPPQLIAATAITKFENLETETSAFPTVFVSDWCGEWKAFKDGK